MEDEVIEDESSLHDESIVELRSSAELSDTDSEKSDSESVSDYSHESSDESSGEEETKPVRYNIY